MESGLGLTVFDFAVVIIFILFVARGAWVGFIRQITVLVSLYLGYIVAAKYNDQLFPFLRSVSENPKVVFLVACAILFGATYVLAMLAGKGLSGVVQMTIAGWFDRFLGALVGCAKAIIVVVLVCLLLGAVLAPENEILRKSRLYPIFTQVVENFRSMIKSEDIRTAFRQKEPAIMEEGVKPFMPTLLPDKKSSPVK